MEIIGILLIILAFLGIYKQEIKVTLKKTKKCALEDCTERVIETIKVSDSRPLIEKGLIVVHYIGTSGMSLKQAEEEIASFIADYSDGYETSEKNKIGNKFAFYKEYWLSDNSREGPYIEFHII